jgi:hypothetical protein
MLGLIRFGLVVLALYYLLFRVLPKYLGPRFPRIPLDASISGKEHPITLAGHSDRASDTGGEAMSNDGFFSRLTRVFSNRASDPVASPSVTPLTSPVEMDYEDSRIPAGAKEKVRRILACLAEVEELMAREQIAGFTRVDIEQMRQQHLPKLIKSYIDIPPAHRSEIFRRTGKSASYVLEDSLGQMQAKVDDIMRNLAQHDLDAFADNTRFIKERYTSSNPFD